MELNKSSMIVRGMTILLAVILFGALATYIGQVSESDEVYNNVDSTQTILTSSTDTLTPIGEGITSSEVKANNQTWLDFEDSKITIEDDSSLDLNKTFTISWWGVQNSYVVGGGFFDKYQTSGNQRSYRIFAVDTNEIGVTFSADGSVGEDKASGLNCGFTENDVWTHFAVVRNESNVQYYKNGVFCDGDTLSINNETFNSSIDLLIGQRIADSLKFNGSMDEVKFYKNNLLPYQITDIFNSSIKSRNNKKDIFIILYHSVGMGYDNHKSADVSLENFTNQMAYLNSSGFSTITFEDYSNWRDGNYIMPEKPIILTFDLDNNGSRSVYTNATPIMDSYGFVGVAGIVTHRLTVGTDINWTMLKELKDKGWEMAGHSTVHSDYVNDYSVSERIEDFNLVYDEIVGNLSVNPITFIYPLSSRNMTTDEECRDAGYVYCLGSELNILPTITKSHSINFQTNISGDDTMRRTKCRNDTTLENFILILDPLRNNSLKLDFDENQGTIAYDTSGNANHGTITGATWSTDGILKTLTTLTDYTIDTATGLFTIVNSDYTWSELKVTWDYHEGYGFHVSILKIIAGFVCLIVLGSAIVLLKGVFDKDEIQK